MAGRLGLTVSSNVMEYAPLNINLRDLRVGSIRFIETHHIRVSRTAFGFRIELPVEISLWLTEANRIPVVRNLRVRLSVRDDSGVQTEIATLAGEGVHQGFPQGHPCVHYLQWTGPVQVLAHYERLRNGKPPRFQTELSGEISLFAPTGETGLGLSSVPEIFYTPGELEYSADLWCDILKRIGFADLVTVETPIEPNPPEGFGGVWNHMTRARDLLLRGGDFAWEACAAAVRTALEEWERLEPLTDDGKTTGTHPSKRQRLDRLRRGLRNYMSFSLHPQGASKPEEAVNWSREDAILGVATLCALLAVRKP